MKRGSILRGFAAAQVWRQRAGLSETRESGEVGGGGTVGWEDREAERGGASRRSPSPPGRRRRWTGGHSLLPDGVPTNPSRGRHPGGPVTPQHAGRLSG